MKHLKSIFMLLIISVVLMACDTNGTNHIRDNSDDPKIIYKDTVITIYKHKDGGTITGYRYVYVSKTGQVTTAPYYK